MFFGGKNKNTITYHDMFVYAYILIHLLAITGKENGSLLEGVLVFKVPGYPSIFNGKTENGDGT